MSVSSYQLSERVNAQTILFWTVAIPIYRAGLATLRTCQAIRAALPSLLFALAILTKVLGLVAVVAGGAFLALAFWVVLAKVAFALVVIAAFAWATYPRTRKPRSGWAVQP